MTMTSSELLPSVMSATLLKEAVVTLSALRATFSATHPCASKAMTNRGHGRGVLFRALYSHSCRFLLRRYTTKSASCYVAARHQLHGVPNTHRHSVTCVRIFLGHLPMHRACYRYAQDDQLFHPVCLFIIEGKKRRKNDTQRDSDHKLTL